MGDDEDCSKPICMDSPYGNFRKNFPQHHQVECPLDRQELGRFSWSLLHTFAAYYPETPSATDKEAMNGLIVGFKQLYPCKHCRGHFQKDCERGMKMIDYRSPELGRAQVAEPVGLQAA